MALPTITIHSLRIIASFALLGAVVCGVATGWMEHQAVDYRAIGAVVGALSAVGLRARHLI